MSHPTKCQRVTWRCCSARGFASLTGDCVRWYANKVTSTAQIQFLHAHCGTRQAASVLMVMVPHRTFQFSMIYGACQGGHLGYVNHPYGLNPCAWGYLSLMAHHAHAGHPLRPFRLQPVFPECIQTAERAGRVTA